MHEHLIIFERYDKKLIQLKYLFKWVGSRQTFDPTLFGAQLKLFHPVFVRIIEDKGFEHGVLR